MKTLIFAKRTLKEILRDPLTFVFGLGFPVIILLLLTAIQRNIPAELFSLDKLTPGIAIFGLSFLTLFSATLIAQDRQNELLSRLCTTPMKPRDFILGYTLPLLPISLAQTFVCYLVAILLGLKLTINALFAVLFTVPASLLFIFMGLAAGSIMNVKQVGGLCGALLTNLTAWLSGTWFDLEIVGKPFKIVSYCFPFVHAVESGRDILSGNSQGIFIHILILAGYIVLFGILAILAFSKTMKKR